jgi:hypothetical protein
VSGGWPSRNADRIASGALPAVSHQLEEIVRPSRTRFFAAAAGLILVIAAAGCGHRLVAPPGQTAVLIFPDRQSVTKVEQMIKKEGILGAIGAAGETAKAKPIVGGTHVKVLSSDQYSVEVVVTSGPYKGLHGFVMKDAIN